MPGAVASPNSSIENMAHTGYEPCTNYSTTATIKNGSPVARDPTLTDTYTDTAATKRYAGVAALVAANAYRAFGILANPRRPGGDGLVPGGSGLVCTEGLCLAWVNVPANCALAVGDPLYPVLSQTYLQPYNLVANASGAGLVNFAGGIPFAIAAQAVATSTSAQLTKVWVEVVKVSRLMVVRAVHQGGFTADYPTTPTSNYAPFFRAPVPGRFVAAGMTTRVQFIDATDPLNFVLDIVKAPAGAKTSIFSTTPRLGPAAAQASGPAAHSSTIFDYDATYIRNGVLSATPSRAAPGDNYGYSIDLTATTPDTAIGDITVEAYFLPDW